MDSYHCTRPHSRRSCYGKTPMQTFFDSKHLVKEKILDQQFEGPMESKEDREKHVEERAINKTGLTPFSEVV